LRCDALRSEAERSAARRSDALRGAAERSDAEQNVLNIPLDIQNLKAPIESIVAGTESANADKLACLV
jgi:hypothetical protein